MNDHNIEPMQLIEAQDSFNFCLNETPNDDYKLDVQDEITVTVFGERELSGDFTLDTNGHITMPLIGEVGVSGCTLSQTKQIITNLYADGYLVNPTLSVDILSYRPIYILGEVRAPGRFDYTEGLTILKTVALAGGFTYRADKKNVQIVRKNANGITYTINHSPHVKVVPGDIITVKERFF